MGALLQQYDDTQHAQVRRGDLVEGVVVVVDRDEILVDIGGKMEAVVAQGEQAGEPGEEPLRRGDHISAVVIASENAEGRPVISVNRARAEIGWRELQTKFDAGDIIEGEVVDQNKGGLIVAANGVRGFVPLSQIVELRRGGPDEQVEEKLRAMRGQMLFLKVIEMNRRRNRLILSERAATKERRAALKDRLLDELQPGEVRHGRVSSLTDFGAFVDLGGADGLIHLSELSWGQVQHPSQVLKIGQELDVRVVGIDRENKKIALSLKQVEENPWARIEQKYQLGQTVFARVTKLAQFGAFAEVEPGVEGLIHISELSEERITHPKQVVREGEQIGVRIIKIESQRHRLGLSLRQAEDIGEGESLPIESWGGGSYGSFLREEDRAEESPTGEQADAVEYDQVATGAEPEEEEVSESTSSADLDHAEPAPESDSAPSAADERDEGSSDGEEGNTSSVPVDGEAKPGEA
jgi:small subunit ribosomal protein S1